LEISYQLSVISYQWGAFFSDQNVGWVEA
jgi:hypothetical protein